MSSLYNTPWIKHKLVVSIYSNTETSLTMSTLAVWCRVVRSRDFSGPCACALKCQSGLFPRKASSLRDLSHRQLSQPYVLSVTEIVLFSWNQFVVHTSDTTLNFNACICWYASTYGRTELCLSSTTPPPTLQLLNGVPMHRHAVRSVTEVVITLLSVCLLSACLSVANGVSISRRRRDLYARL